MTSTDATPPGAKPGLVERTLSRWFLRSTRVATVTPVSENVFLIDLEGDALKGANWTPGDKLQVKVGSPMVTRTFTPILFDAVRGRTRLLGYAHGAAPGSDWLRQARPGDACEVFGPHRSLALGGITGPVALFGDETSFGLAAAMSGHAPPGLALRCVFEVGSVQEALQVLQALPALPAPAVLVARGNEAHLVGTVRDLLATAGAGAQFALTGRAQAIQAVRTILREYGVPASRVMAKAYWSPGKTGLD